MGQGDTGLYQVEKCYFQLDISGQLICSTRAWKIPWTEETGRLQSMGSLRVGHD